MCFNICINNSLSCSCCLLHRLNKWALFRDRCGTHLTLGCTWNADSVDGWIWSFHLAVEERMASCSLALQPGHSCSHASWVTPSMFSFFFLPHPVACRMFVPRLGIERLPPEVEGWSFNHWTARKVREHVLSNCCLRAKLLNHIWLCNPMDCSPPGSSVHGILQSRILEWVATPSSRTASQPRDRTWISFVSCIGRWLLYHWCHLGSP